MSPYNTHLPILEYALERHNDFVLEFGGGEFSTPLIIKKSKESVTFENNLEWYKKLKACETFDNYIIKTNSYIHSIKEMYKCCTVVDDITQYEYILSYRERFSLAFIDGDNWNERCELVDYLSDKCDVVILHDSFPEHLERCAAHLGRSFKYAYTMNVYPTQDGSELRGRPEYPPTLVLSNYYDFKDWKINV